MNHTPRSRPFGRGFALLAFGACTHVGTIESVVPPSARISARGLEGEWRTASEPTESIAVYRSVDDTLEYRILRFADGRVERYQGRLGMIGRTRVFEMEPQGGRVSDDGAHMAFHGFAIVDSIEPRMVLRFVQWAPLLEQLRRQSPRAAGFVTAGEWMLLTAPGDSLRAALVDALGAPGVVGERRVMVRR